MDVTAVEPWHEFAVMIGGAAAALVGLLVVAMSINVEEIIGDPTLPRRAGGALVTTITPLVLCVFVLIPGQSRSAFGWELIALGIVLALLLPFLNRPATQPEQQTRTQWLLSTCLPMTVLILAVLLAGVGVLVDGLGGLYWLPVAVLAALLGGLIQAWVLLIEIRR
jgi:hypothetical protein